MTAQKKLYLFGNWKMNLGPSQAQEFGAKFRSLVSASSEDRAVWALFPPFLSLAALKEGLGDSPVSLGVQDVSDQPSGAFTGQVSASMAKESGCRYAIVGHSERRQYQGETSALVAAKAAACRAAGIIPVVCVGESLEQREAGQTQTIIDEQIAPVLQALEGSHDWLIAYEPIWAIGTGKAALPSDAQAVCQRLADQSGVPVLYGGSVKPENAGQYFAQPAVSGALVGGASLKPEVFFSLAEI
ncbi:MULTISPECIES: triose-phosphate isomerase [Jonquetella]|uniref:Triosephosphate isomerase n=1 Tax=Jonquetella anthropi DSM 22815 TaxID=885272 RepID=H0UKA4_9BACT|nr:MULTISPECIES: triose-phosphate isomerase [Jonquetella]EEX48494.1 triose-phosphate isomerase [Jonquetella anthropi E3_33 E1]EHM13113.1 triosephosphate isomerase [Jonquetella anthropi DSM 22815]ERL23899.1 triose-phosphate isomerase [Jonquetella sp. BV3C21]